MIFTFSFITTVWYYFTFNELLNIHLLFWSQLNILSLEKSHWLCRVVRHVLSCSGHWYKRRCLMRIHWDNGRAWEQTLGLNFLFLHWKTSLMIYWCGTLVPKKKKERKKTQTTTTRTTTKTQMVGFSEVICNSEYFMLRSSVMNNFVTPWTIAH